MFQNQITLKDKHSEFVKTICNKQLVYALKNQEGYATSYSNEFENENGNPVMIICFWSEKALAKSCIEKEWSDYSLNEMNLAEFVENWCVGMSLDGLIIGTNFDKNLFGYEVNPLELILEIIQELKSTNKDLKLKKFDNLSDLEKQVKEIIDEYNSSF